jgi:uncharacterized protein
MWKNLPNWVAPWSLAQLGQRLQGQVPLIQMVRLVREFSIKAGFAQVELAFDCDKNGRCYVQGWIRARLPLICQRCLQPLEWSVDAHPRLGLMVAESEVDRWPNDYDPWVVKPQEQASLWRLVEDELFLALPIVARHPLGECKQHVLAGDKKSVETIVREEKNPFAALKRLNLKAKKSF